jgi:hypothetical protein
MVGVGDLVPRLEAGMAVVLVMALAGREDGDDQELRRTRDRP